MRITHRLFDRWIVPLCVTAAILCFPAAVQAMPFTFDFTMTWQSTSNPGWGNGALMSFTADNGAVSPLGQTYSFQDVDYVLIDTTAFGGTYADRWRASTGIYPQPHPLFSVSNSGVAIIDFASRASDPSDQLLVIADGGGFYVARSLVFRWSQNQITYEHSCGFPSDACGGYGVVAVSTQLVGTVPDAGGTLPLLGLALAALAVVRYQRVFFALAD